MLNYVFHNGEKFEHMTITAKIIEDSISPQNIRLSTLQLRFPRYILPQFNTHRSFSKSVQSSRAIPVNKLIKDIIDDPVIPIYWGKNIPGMKAVEECNELVDLNDFYETDDMIMTNKEAWLAARDVAIEYASAFEKSGYHKEIINRILEPFAHVNVVLSSTKFENFFNLRIHEDAQPEIKKLAEEIKNSLDNSIPKQLDVGEWHTPYISMEERITLPIDITREISAARCARVSYKLFDGSDTSVEKDLELFEKLAGSTPIHASPLEHQATPDGFGNFFNMRWDFQESHGNFFGWSQHRKCFEISKNILSNQ